MMTFGKKTHDDKFHVYKGLLELWKVDFFWKLNLQSFVHLKRKKQKIHYSICGLQSVETIQRAKE